MHDRDDRARKSSPGWVVVTRTEKDRNDDDVAEGRRDEQREEWRHCCGRCVLCRRSRVTVTLDDDFQSRCGGFKILRPARPVDPVRDWRPSFAGGGVFRTSWKFWMARPFCVHLRLVNLDSFGRFGRGGRHRRRRQYVPTCTDQTQTTDRPTDRRTVCRSVDSLTS